MNFFVFSNFVIFWLRIYSPIYNRNGGDKKENVFLKRVRSKVDGPKLTVQMDERHLNWKIRLEFNGLDSNWTILESGRFPEINESSSFADRLSRSFETPSVIDDPPLSSTLSHDRLLWTWSSEENMKILSNFWDFGHFLPPKKALCNYSKISTVHWCFNYVRGSWSVKLADWVGQWLRTSSPTSNEPKSWGENQCSLCPDGAYYETGKAIQGHLRS